MASSPSSLSPLQIEALHAFFGRERRFCHAFERGRFVLTDVASALSGRLDIRQDTPRFLRTVLSRGDDALVIDLVRDLQYQLHADKLERDGILVDPADEILANKLTTLVSRAEERDLVDVFCLERAGYRVEDALPAALAKDGGCTPATLAWLLSEVSIPDGLHLPAGVTPGELRNFVADLIVRLRRAALPA